MQIIDGHFLAALVRKFHTVFPTEGVLNERRSQSIHAHSNILATVRGFSLPNSAFDFLLQSLHK